LLFIVTGRNLSKKNHNRNYQCPFLRKPEKDCYCINMDSQEKIMAAINYCNGIYEECEVYKNLMRKRVNK
jgi:hypothetical protein